MNRRTNKQWVWVMAGLVIIVLAAGVFYKRYRTTVTPEQVVIANQHPYTPSVNSNNSVQNSNANTNSAVPVEYALEVPFTPQAPTANWDELHGEACEEASALMVNAYFSGDTRETLPPKEVEAEISKLTEWQQSNFGYYLDTTAAETAKMIEAVYDLKAKVVPALSEKDLKAEIAKGNLVIIPAQGQQLENPYFTQPGPIYHMIVVRGFTKDKIITNDPGTKRGENYAYSYTILQKAGADWDHSIDSVSQAKKVMIIVSK